ncbi:MAG: 4-hydroxyphenylpyruvate dioxygenase [Gammaproteobacteria bacterium]|nr:4-hydroxyphenylpyruvate dioxygenase [Gammaproteobacteria bacterium]MCH9744025.1 4-hydroxyphenylpyruvate dioxygenase [Gammaproteobacteria bacterium]
MSEWKVFYETEDENPAGVDGFEFLEFADPNPDHLRQIFTDLGFVKVATHKTLDVELWQQGSIKFIINAAKDSFASAYIKKHGGCTCGMGFHVNDTNAAMTHVLAKGASVFEKADNHWADDTIKAITGIGETPLYLIDHDFYNDFFDFDMAALKKVNNEVGLTYLDHVTHNLLLGNMDEWATFYGKLFNFTQLRYFNIQGQQTGLLSRALRSPCKKICIPLNEPKDEKSQIKEFTDELKGEGIQHIALGTKDIYTTIEVLRERGQKFLNTPDTYYRLIEKRLPGQSEPVERMKKNKILIDGEGGADGKRLLQIFTETEIGPVFFEIIQRKGDEGFGEGNFQALFESIELDQIERGYLQSNKEESADDTNH